MFLSWFNEPLSLDVKLHMSWNFGIKCLSMSLYSAGGDRETQIHLLTASFHCIVNNL